VVAFLVTVKSIGTVVRL